MMVSGGYGVIYYDDIEAGYPAFTGYGSWLCSVSASSGIRRPCLWCFLSGYVYYVWRLGGVPNQVYLDVGLDALCAFPSAFVTGRGGIHREKMTYTYILGLC